LALSCTHYRDCKQPFKPCSKKSNMKNKTKAHTTGCIPVQ
jgi:hypothetical protein